MPYSALRYVTDIRTSRCGLWITAEVSFAATIICDHIDMAAFSRGDLREPVIGDALSCMAGAVHSYVLKHQISPVIYQLLYHIPG
eukprot:s412_g4.t1